MKNLRWPGDGIVRWVFSIEVVRTEETELCGAGLLSIGSSGDEIVPLVMRLSCRVFLHFHTMSRIVRHVFGRIMRFASGSMKFSCDGVLRPCFGFVSPDVFIVLFLRLVDDSIEKVHNHDVQKLHVDLIFSLLDDEDDHSVRRRYAENGLIDVGQQAPPFRFPVFLHHGSGSWPRGSPRPGCGCRARALLFIR